MGIACSLSVVDVMGGDGGMREQHVRVDLVTWSESILSESRIVARWGSSSRRSWGLG